jgi:hypothetical protein
MDLIMLASKDASINNSLCQLIMMRHLAALLLIDIINKVCYPAGGGAGEGGTPSAWCDILPHHY